MAYGTRYQGQYSNEIQVLFTVDIKQKDYVGDPETFIVQDLELSDSTDEGAIIAREARLDIRCAIGSAIDWETFLTGNYDEWYIEVYDENYCHFEGFLTPEEGNAPFLDKPYSITIRASNALKLLKDANLTRLDGSNFKGKFTLSDYLVAALAKTLISLPVRVYGSLYTSVMDNRDGNPAATHWNQTKLDARTFLKDATTFDSSYDTLVRLLDRTHRLYYFNRMWVVFFTHEHQYAPGGLWYTDFDAAGAVIGGGEDTTGYATVGKAEAIFPINADALLNSSFPIKFAKTNFNYKTWPEIPLNNKFERGTIIGSGTDVDGNLYEDKIIEDWTPTMVDITVTPPNFDFDPVEGDLFLRRTFDIYGIEIKREIFFETPTTASPGGSYVKWLMAEPLPVNKGDQIKLDVGLRYDNDITTGGDGFAIIGRVYLVPDEGTDYYALDNNQAGIETGKGRWKLESGGAPNFISVDLPQDSDSRNLKNQSILSDTIPANGTLYIALQHSNDGTNAGGNKWFSAIDFEYIPYVAGGFIPISGDYWIHSQSENQIDKDEGDIGLSDCLIRVMQGCLFNADGLTATRTNWYRYGVQESRHYKEIVNWARYNLGRRRYWQLDGSFKGIYYEASNDLTALAPISYHKNYRLQDPAQPRDMILVPPLTIDLCKGHIKAIFEEVINPALSTNYGADMYRVINGLINQVAVVHGLVLERYPPDPRMMRLTSALGTTITSSANDGGAGNTPVLTVNTQSDLVSFHEAILTIGEDIEIGNTFTISVDGTPATYTVIDIIEQSDGTQPGDSSSFNYIFSKT